MGHNNSTDAEYAANLVGKCQRATVQFIAWICCRAYLHNDIFLTDMTGYDWLKFS